MNIQPIILAAGCGKRTANACPKVLLTLANKPLLKHVLEKAYQVSSLMPIVVIGYQSKLVKNYFSNENVIWVEQRSQLGTAHAVQQTLPLLKQNDRTLILYGDVPLISISFLEKLITNIPKKGIGLLTAYLPKPAHYGRIIRENGEIISIVEHKDASPAQRKIHEVNSGIYIIPTAYLQKCLPRLLNINTRSEYYLTDIIKLAIREKIEVQAIKVKPYEEILGVNSMIELACAERIYQKQNAKKLLEHGVQLFDPKRFDLRGEIQHGKNLRIDINVILEGQIKIGDNCFIGANSFLRDVTIGHNVIIKPNSIVEEAMLEDNVNIGPFARLRPGSVLSKQAHIGNFVEIKNSKIGANTKVNHLSYIGDCEVGYETNIGAGTITCNYDGHAKHKTIIGNNVFVGSGTELVAPIKVGDGAIIGAGSILTKDVSPEQTTITHVLQQRSLPRAKKKET